MDEAAVTPSKLQEKYVNFDLQTMRRSRLLHPLLQQVRRRAYFIPRAEAVLDMGQAFRPLERAPIRRKIRLWSDR